MYRLSISFTFLLIVLPLSAADASELDWSTWRHMPTFDRGRAMPVDTFARSAVEEICGSTQPKLRLTDSQPRRFSAAELLFSWLVEPQRWERVPFLRAEHERLRTELLGLPIVDGNGRRLKYVSPRQLENAVNFRRRLGEIRSRATSDDKAFHPSVLEKKVGNLAAAYQRYRLLAMTLRLTPALDPAALASDRNDSNYTQPWLDFQTLIHGSKDELAGYPCEPLERVRSAFEHVKDIYTDRDNQRCKEEFTTAMDCFAAAVRTLGERIEPIRRKLLIRNKDEALIALTAYPPPGATDLEVQYNSSDPFLWSWIISLLATVCFCLSFGAIRKPMFWLGFLVLATAQGFIVYGFAMRVAITGWAPVANMFETVVFTAWVAAVLGLWFTLLPLIWPGLSVAWGLSQFSRSENGTVPFLVLPLRLALAAGVFYLMVIADYGSGEDITVISLLPKTAVGLSVPTANALLSWSVGMCVLVASMLYVPRVIVAVVLSSCTIPYTLTRHGIDGPLEQTYSRKLFVAVGSAVAFFAAILAYYSPIFHSDISPLMPVLRNNFWLMMHVLSITASYGAAALAWGLGNIAIGYYLFGRYRNPDVPADLAVDSAADLHRRPPATCATLAGFEYKAIQVAVLLLAAGTILGALWADVSWGRFWGWDPKEVWALVSLLVYMIVLHGRHVRWFGNFGMAVGSVFGLSAVVWAWYGVNYLLPGGLHTYGSGTGGQREVLAAMTANWLYVAAAAVRYNIEVRKRN